MTEGSSLVNEIRAAAEQVGSRRYKYDPLLSALHERLRERDGPYQAANQVGLPPLRVCRRR